MAQSKTSAGGKTVALSAVVAGALGVFGTKLVDRLTDTAVEHTVEAAEFVVAYLGLRGEREAAANSGIDIPDAAAVDTFETVGTPTVIAGDSELTDVTVFHCEAHPETAAAARTVVDSLPSRLFGQRKIVEVRLSGGAELLFGGAVTVVYDADQDEREQVPDIFRAVTGAGIDRPVQVIPNAGVATPFRLNVFIC